MQPVSNKPTIAVFYLARATDLQADAKFARFAASYREHQAGASHDLFVIFKGFASASDMSVARRIFSGLNYDSIVLADEGFDLGSYFAAASQVDHELVCFFNTSSIIQSALWLHKLARNLSLPHVGIVGATGSFEVPGQPRGANLTFPNVHLRSNAILIRRTTFLEASPAKGIGTKSEVYEVEHGVNSLTHRVMRKGLFPLIVGRNGRGYAPEFWPLSDTFRQGEQANLLVRDNQTETFRLSPFHTKRQLFGLSWGNGEPARSLHDLSPALR